MKFLVPIFFFCCLSFSQTKDSIYGKMKTISAFNYKLDSLSNLKPNFNYNYKTTDANLFSIYNRNTTLNDYFIVSKDNSNYVKSVSINSNQFLHIDSFNPNGVSDLGAGLIIGALNTFLKFRFKSF